MNRRFAHASMTQGFLAALLVAAALHVGACARPAGATKFTQVTADTTYTESDPAPSPDGKWIAFISDRSGSRQLWVRPTSGGESKQLSHEADSVRCMTPTWAPDGKSILFISTRTKDYNVYRIPMEGGEAVPMSDAKGSNRFATYSPDASKILFTSNRLRPGELWGFNLFVMDAAGEKAGEKPAKQITDSQGSPGHPVWSPDGKWVAYVAKAVDTTKTVDVGPGMTAKQSAMFSAYRLWKVPADGGVETQLTGLKSSTDPTEEVWPHWSPDGKWIAVQGRVGNRIDVWVYEVATGAFFPLTNFGDASKPTWSSDSKSIWFTRFTGIKESIWLATELNLTPPAKKPAAKKKTPTKG